MRFLLATLLTINFFTASANAVPAYDCIPYVIFDDFETGELFGWEPYPYQQDIGYDPMYFTRRSPTYNNSRYALARPVKANDTVELYQGFTKRINLRTTTDTRLKVAVFFQSDRNPEKLELSLGTFDGRRYMHTIYNPEANRWVEIDLPAGAFKFNGHSLAPGEHIQVVTLKATYPIVYYLFTYTILMDDFSLNGERQRRFSGIEPESIDLEMFDVSILNKHYFYGETISLSVRPEGNVQLSRVLGRLIDGDGGVVRDNIPFKASGKGDWINDSVYRLTERDSRGQWEIRLTGSREGSPDIEWGLKFLMPGNRIVPEDHPRLFFSGNELKERIENERSPVAMKILENALADTSFMLIDISEIEEAEDLTAEALTGGPYGKYFVGMATFDRWFNTIVRFRNVITGGSFRYAFSGDVEAGQKAKEALLKLSTFSKWTYAWMVENKFHTYLRVSGTMQSISYGYDMLHPLMSPEEREFVRKAIMEKGLDPYRRDIIEMNRMPSSTTNHLGAILTGYGLCAITLYGEDPENPYMEPHISGTIERLKIFAERTFKEDGSYLEPHSYQHLSTMIVDLFAAFERNFGIDFTNTTFVRNHYLLPLYATDSNNRIQDFGDAGRAYNFTRYKASQWFTYRLKDPFLYNYVKPFWEAGNGGYFGYLLYTEGIEPKSRDVLPTSRAFSSRGMVMRSGWEDESTIIHTFIGPNSNHYHYDQGNFQIMTNGEELLSDAGSGGDYYKNLEFVVYNIHSIAHNVMLIDYDPESQAPAHYDNGIAALRDWPRMVHSFAGEIADAVEGDLASVYKGKLEKYTRTLLYTKTGPLFLFDSVRSVSSDGHIYNWLFHAPMNQGGRRSIRYSDQRLSIERSRARLTMDVVSPVIDSNTIRDTSYSESFATLSISPRLREANFLAVILPEAKPENEDYGPLPVTTGINESGWLGARVERGSLVDYAYFRESGSAAIGGFTTDASRFTASFEDGDIYKAYLEGSQLSGNGLEVRSDSKLTCALEFKESGMDIEVQTDKECTLSIVYDERPGRITVNGAVARNWKYDSNRKALHLNLPSGRNNISIR